MKKLFVVLCVVVIAFAFTSCKKTCECTTILLGTVVSTVEYEVKGNENCAKFVTYDAITQSGIKCDKK